MRRPASLSSPARGQRGELAWAAVHAPAVPSICAAAATLAVAWAAARRRLVPLFLAAAPAPLLLPGWQIVLGLAAAAELARVAVGQPPRWRTPLTAAAALATGLLAAGHLPGGLPPPESPLVPAALAWPLAGAALAGAVLAWRTRRLSHLPLAFTFPAVGLGILSLRDPAWRDLLAAFSLAGLAATFETRRRWPASPPSVLDAPRQGDDGDGREEP